MVRRSIADLVSTLRTIDPGSFSRERVLAEIGRVAIDAASVERYMFFNDTHYTRNLVFRCDLFEVVALGWASGQAAAVHNHRGQECWMGLAEGRLEVRNFKLLDRDPKARRCKLERGGAYVLDPDHPAAVDPLEPIHSVHNLPEFGSRAVSIHVYSRPIDWCEVYYPEQGRYIEMKLCYTSREGVLCPGEVARAAAS